MHLCPRVNYVMKRELRWAPILGFYAMRIGSAPVKRGDKSKELRGVFATRSPVRPNPIAISDLKVLRIHGGRLEVSGLDILDGTPIVDIKKKISYSIFHMT